MKVSEVMFLLLRNELNGEKLPDNLEYDIEKLFALAKRHDLAHLISDALIRNGLVTDKYPDYRKIRKEKVLAIYREEHRTFNYKKITSALSKAGIDYIPLKGMIVRDLYPEQWMRTSCDIDILVREDDLDKAKDVLVTEGYVTDGKKGYHDISFYNGKAHLELHFNVCENNKQIDKLLEKIWSYSYSAGGHEYLENKEFFVFHHVAHIAYHMLSGGCGIRPVLDLYVMRRKGFYDDNGLIALLDQCDLTNFYNAVVALSEVWFGGEKHTELTKKMSEYIIKGGVYGNEYNSLPMSIGKKKGKFRYMMSLAFLPYENMCVIYPKLKGRKALLPFYYVHRIFSKLFGKDKKHTREQVGRINAATSGGVENVISLMDQLGLDRDV